MVGTLIRKFVRYCAVSLCVTFIVFALMYGNGEAIAHSVLGVKATPEAIATKVSELGLDRPLFVQYGEWLTNALHGDLGRSFYTGQKVNEALMQRVPVTFSIVIPSLLLAAVISVLLGVLASVRGGVADRVVQTLSVLGNAIPSFIVAIALVFFFAIWMKILPPTGYVSPAVSISQWAATITLPVLTLLVGGVASAAQQFRTAMLDTLGQDYVRTLRARGLSEANVIFRHVLRNAAAPGMTVVSLTVFNLLGGAVFIEQVFALPGYGQLGNVSAQTSDVPMVMGTVAVTVVVVVVVNFVADLLIAALNPKARKNQ
ncbi:ABC transporter permease [Bifidobacterium sp. SO4]|uniref:ABC transporter permease n=1 Tax=Bifidobacterium sp. SO4 TaxID=2809030 RepID=UPI001BDCB368|nr:ABC transporter permease [Bifidobacterium sp. SO4]MBT1170615.1 ABC transporter permease [Bifidobacterium sp. SO4]